MQTLDVGVSEHLWHRWRKQRLTKPVSLDPVGVKAVAALVVAD
jgi:hypothetical protein